jgi:aerobic-type carbon monoxide dehydrogenase small subunit (CoxS/CutS family)
VKCETHDKSQCCLTAAGPDQGLSAPLGALGVSRRRFILGIIASSAVATAGGRLRAGPLSPVAAGPVGNVDRLLTLMVNGQKRRVDVLPQETLTQTLRYKLGLTGTKLGCDRGECGVCTVLADDVPIYSCMTLTHRVRGKKITTIEGIEGPNGELHKVQQAFIDEFAPQCGFCTPAQAMTAVALLKANPSPTVEEARIAMSGNLCRCGAYDGYLRAVMRAAKGA